MKKKMTLLLVTCLTFSNISSLFNFYPTEVSAEEVNEIEGQNDDIYPNESSIEIEKDSPTETTDILDESIPVVPQADSNNVNPESNEVSENDELIQIPDGWLRTVIQRELPGITPTNKDSFKKSELEQLTAIGVNDPNDLKEVKDLTGLEYAINLETVNLDRATLITDLTPLKNTTKIKQFNLNQNKNVTDLSPLRNNSELTQLSIRLTNITDLSAITNEIRTLDVGYTNVPTSELLKFSKLNNLEYSGHKNVSTEDLQNIATLQNLTNLSLAEDGLQDGMVDLLAPLSLEIFSAPYNNFISLDGFEKLNYSNMTGITINGNHIMDLSVFEPMIVAGAPRPINAMQQTFTFDRQISYTDTIKVANQFKDPSSMVHAPNSLSPNDGSVTYDGITDEIIITGTAGKSGRAKATSEYTSSDVTYDAEIEIPYEFRVPNPAEAVTVHYQDINGHKLIDDITLTGNIDENYQTEQKNIDGYTFKEVLGNASGKFTDVAQEVTYIYSKNPIKAANVTVHYQDINGNKLTDDKVLSGNIGDDYQSEQLDFNGYTFKEVLGNASGILSDTAQEVTYIYSKNPIKAADITVHYQDINGNKLTDDKVLSGNIGDDYQSEQLDFNGYTFKEVLGDTSGKFSDNVQEVTYVYELSDGAAVTVQYINEDGTSIAKEETLTGKLGSNYEAQAKQIEGFTLKETPENASGTFTEKEQVVTFEYRKTMSNQPSTPPTNTDKENTNSSSKPKHNKEASVLPQTGEYQSSPILVAIGVFLIGSIVIMVRKKKNF